MSKDWRNDPRTNEELLHVALTEEDEDLAWGAIAALHGRGSPDTFDAARQLCASEDANERCVGADILGQLGYSMNDDSKFHEESVIILLDMLEHEQDLDVLHSIAMALGWRHDTRAIEPLVRFKNHPDLRVREGVVHSLGDHEDDLAIATLIELSADPESLIRDWATFSLGAQIGADTTAIRSALLARTADEDAGVRGEAIRGLARRHDERTVEALIPLLDAGMFWGDLTRGDYFRFLALEAAEELGDPRLLPLLERLRQKCGQYDGVVADWLYSRIEEAIEACQPRSED